MIQKRLVLPLALLLLCTSGCDLGWRRRSTFAQRRGLQFLIKGDEAAAAREFTRALQADPYLGPSNAGLAQLYLASGDELATAWGFGQRAHELERAEGNESLRPWLSVVESILHGEVENPVEACREILWLSRLESSILKAHRLCTPSGRRSWQVLRERVGPDCALRIVSLYASLVVVEASSSSSARPVRLSLVLDKRGFWTLAHVAAARG
ncbi:MAG: hypothetical protein ACYTGH_00445 [Planctomycetota bacterium]|jgi:hypothetical protein